MPYWRATGISVSIIIGDIILTKEIMFPWLLSQFYHHRIVAWAMLQRGGLEHCYEMKLSNQIDNMGMRSMMGVHVQQQKPLVSRLTLVSRFQD